ncbi:MAG: 1,4-dihydroxy-2-naphthoate octaprenyltransferase [Rhizobiales bacterium]|nr:1,4-dihydroxy-2-naphthoate octaprenyltransferase [Hyphomicrobiales bacterium]
MSDAALPPIANPVPARRRVWVQAIRFRSFTASTIPIAVGSLLALVDRQFSLPLLVLMLLASMACHAGANMANDYFDFKKGIDNPDSIGANKVILQGRLTASEVKRGMTVAFAIATALGLIVVYETSWEILALALVSLAAAYFYTGGPKPLGYMALGELVSFVFMGPVMVGGAYFAMTETVTWPVLIVACAVGCLVAAIMHANNIRDIETDRAAGKTTIATLSGRALANQEYRFLIAGAPGLIVLLIAFDRGWWPLLTIVIALPAALRLGRFVASAAGAKDLNLLLRKTAGLHLRFGVALILGLLLRVILDRL